MRNLLEELDDLLAKDGRTASSLEREMGIGKDTFTRWTRMRFTGGNGPSLGLFEAVLNVLGYQLKIERIGEGE
jgi:hypothetical protein